jgi:uncharacterized protein (DUF58 family)
VVGKWADRRDPESSLDDVRRLMESVRRVALRSQGLASSLFAGQHTSPFWGRGLEVAEVREYQAGDDVRFIDWKVTARLGRIHVKQFSEERQIPVLLLVDRSGSLQEGRGREAGRLAIEIAATLALAAEGGGDPVGLLQVTDRVESYLPPRSGRDQGLRLVRDLIRLKPEGRTTALTPALHFARRVLRSRSLLFLISDFLLPEDGQEERALLLRQLSVRHDVIPVRIMDPLRGRLPNVGILQAADPETGRERTVNTDDPRVRNRFQREVREKEAAGELMLRQVGLETLEIHVGEPLGPALRSFFQDRRGKG